MQVQVFSIPTFDSQTAINEMNSFLRSHQIIDVERQLIKRETFEYWAIFVRYDDVSAPPKVAFSKNEKVDYMKVLDEPTFKIFNELRKHRKTLSEKEGVPIYAIFSNEELAKIAALPDMSAQNITKIKGIGAAKAEKYGEAIIKLFSANG